MNMPATENPFKHTKETKHALVEIEGSRAIAETQAAMVIAKKFPRDQIAAMDRILNACSRKSLAESALYSYSKGGSDVSGPSIRMAEMLAQQWGNIQFGIRELEQRNGESTVEAFAWDIETNTRQVKVFQVPHLRFTKKGSYKLEDPREVYEMVANQGARRLRACILGVIPGDVIESSVAQCELTMTSNADTSHDAMQKMLDAFAKFGVLKDQIEKRIQRRIDAIQPAQVVSLKKIYASIRDGMSSASDWFDIDSQEKNVVEPIRPELESISQEKFDQMFPAWDATIKAGKKTPEQVLAFVETKAKLTDEQRNKIKNAGAQQPVTIDADV